MTQNNKQQFCPICSEEYVKSISGANKWMISYECERCGKFNIGLRISSDQPWRDVRHLMSAWIIQVNANSLTADCSNTHKLAENLLGKHG